MWSTMASLSARLGDEPSDSTTRGWVLSAKNGARSTAVNGRSTSRAVAIDGIDGPVPGPDPADVQAPAAAVTAVSAAQR